MTLDDDRVERVRAARRMLAEGGSAPGRAEGDVERVSLPARDGDVLRDVLVAEGAGAVLEVGLAYGGSALAIGEALLASPADRVTHIVIDPYQESFGHAGWQAITAAGLTGICTLIAERSQLALARLAAEQVRVDAAFVDGSHLFHNVFVDLCFIGELVRPGGLVVLDDCDWPAVATAAAYFEANMGWARHPLAEPTRLRAFRLPDPPLRPGFEEFTPFGLDVGPACA